MSYVWTFNDDSEMPFGKYKGEKMANVPAEYLIWLLDNGKCHGPVYEYIKDNEKDLRVEIIRNR